MECKFTLKFPKLINNVVSMPQDLKGIISTKILVENLNNKIQSSDILH